MKGGRGGKVGGKKEAGREEAHLPHARDFSLPSQIEVKKKTKTLSSKLI